MDELHSPNFQLKHNDMKNKHHVHKVFLYLFIFFLQFSLQHCGAQQVSVFCHQQPLPL